MYKDVTCDNNRNEGDRGMEEQSFYIPTEAKWVSIQTWIVIN